jgi:ABC-2 type transport system permease protein
LARFGLAQEFAFRANYLVKLFVEVLWLAILLAFYRTVFAKTNYVAGWSEPQYLFFLGCYFALAGLVEALFLTNCNEFSELIRNGNLDFYLLKPVDEQFLVTCRQIDWGSAPNFLMGVGVMCLALKEMHWAFNPMHIPMFVLLFVSGMGIAYSFLVFLTSVAVWFTRNQSLYELWWLFTSLMRYPREIFSGRSWASQLGSLFTYIIPILLVINVPANIMVKALEPEMILLSLAASVLLLVASRLFFRHALKRYRSASS